MRLKVSNLKFLISESFLNEDVEKQSGISLDSQIDRYFSDFESEAKNSKNEGRDFRALERRLFSEADDDVSDIDPDDIDSGAPVGKVPASAIDVETFANDVARLIANYDSLIEVRSTLARRASAFLSKVYERDAVMAFERTLRDQHGIEAGKSKGELDSEQYAAPPGDHAGGGNESGGAGGGA